MRGPARAVGRLDEADRAFRRALAIAQEIAEPRQTWLSHAALGRFHAERRDMDAAHGAYRAAREVVDRVKEAVRDPRLRAGLEQARVVREIREGST